METPAREAATATGCQRNINLSTVMAAFGKTVFTNFDEFRPFLDQIQGAIPSYAAPPFISIMKVLFRKGVFLVNISDVSKTEGSFKSGGTFKCDVVFSYKKLFTGEVHFYAQKFQRIRKIRNSYSYVYRRVYTEHKFIFITFNYRQVGGGKNHESKKLSFRSYPMIGKNPTRLHNKQPKYRKFMTSVISSMFIDNSNSATEYVMDQ